ncbi:MAG TPA: ClpXP protease specificity-enhancing factor [Sedimenticola sp.]|nr:ClpXP protease specificity-enhancing factor [Sedimenticola sp.]
MISNRPYLIRALFEWLVDCGLTPHLLVEAEGDDVVVPPQHVNDGRIVLNISPGAVRNLQLGNELITFSARFGGIPLDVRIPPGAVLGIYAREDGRGMLFPQDQETTDDGPDEPEPPGPPRDRPSLKVVK